MHIVNSWTVVCEWVIIDNTSFAPTIVNCVMASHVDTFPKKMPPFILGSQWYSADVTGNFKFRVEIESPSGALTKHDMGEAAIEEGKLLFLRVLVEQGFTADAPGLYRVKIVFFNENEHIEGNPGFILMRLQPPAPAPESE